MTILNLKNSQRLLGSILILAMGTSCGVSGGVSLQNGTTTVTTSLVVASTVPASDDIEVDLVKPIALTFSDDVQASTVTTSNLRVSNGGSAISGSWVYNSTSKTATFTPATNYPGGSTITVQATAGVLKTDGSPLTAKTFTFNTVDLSSLIAYWRFDGNGSDYSGNNHTAAATNIVYDTTVVKQGSASAKFAGTSYFDVGTINLGDAFTVAVWVFLPNPIAAGINTVISNGLGGITQNGFKIFINEFGTSNRKIATEAGDGTDGTLLITSANFATLGTWKHLAVVIDKNALASQRALFYFNGALTTQTVGPGSTLANFPNVFGTNQQTYIGMFPGNSFFYTGYMDDFRIYNRVLTQAEVLKISQQD